MQADAMGSLGEISTLYRVGLSTVEADDKAFRQIPRLKNFRYLYLGGPLCWVDADNKCLALTVQSFENLKSSV